MCVLVVFNGLYSYILFIWYVEKFVVLIWNYVVVYVIGKVEYFDDDNILVCFDELIS